jgi:hypothetical protein
VHREEEGGQRDMETEKEIRDWESGGSIKGECNRVEGRRKRRKKRARCFLRECC